MVLGIAQIITNSFGIKEGGMCTLMESQQQTFLLHLFWIFYTDFEGSDKKQSKFFSKNFFKKVKWEKDWGLRVNKILAGCWFSNYLEKYRSCISIKCLAIFLNLHGLRVGWQRLPVCVCTVSLHQQKDWTQHSLMFRWVVDWFSKGGWKNKRLSLLWISVISVMSQVSLPWAGLQEVYKASCFAEYVPYQQWQFNRQEERQKERKMFSSKWER